MPQLQSLQLVSTRGASIPTSSSYTHSSSSFSSLSLSSSASSSLSSSSSSSSSTSMAVSFIPHPDPFHPLPFARGPLSGSRLLLQRPHRLVPRHLITELVSIERIRDQTRSSARFPTTLPPSLPSSLPFSLSVPSETTSIAWRERGVKDEEGRNDGRRG